MVKVPPLELRRVDTRLGPHELKLVWPQAGIDPAELEHWDFGHFLVQPMDCEDAAAALQASISLAMERPRWRLTIQTHKVSGLR